MNVTIFSDASLCPQTRAGGWAGWIKSDRGVLSVDGEFRYQLTDTTIAEAMAALNAICYAISKNHIEKGDILVLATDNNNVMRVLEGQARRKFRRRSAKKQNRTMKEHRLHIDENNRHIATISKIYKSRIVEAGIDLRWNHVKGHTGRPDKRSAVNHGCDRRAKQAMRKARKQKRSD